MFGTTSFLLNINDPHLALKNSEVIIYVEDTSICFLSGSVDDIIRAINEYLEGLNIWLESNKLSSNVLKEQGMQANGSKS